jgi:hypothetical protein
VVVRLNAPWAGSVKVVRKGWPDSGREEHVYTLATTDTHVAFRRLLQPSIAPVVRNERM